MKRSIDIAVSATVLLLVLPIVSVVALAILAILGRPVLFQQDRSGRNGRTFRIMKFRTMIPPAFADQPDDERITRLGRFLRATSLDELPQLWNILRGDMSITGPRPTLPEQVVAYTARQRRRLAVRPGLTGWAQVNGRTSITWPERIELDLWYIENRSPLLDLRIIARSFVKVIRPGPAAEVVDDLAPGSGTFAEAVGPPARSTTSRPRDTARRS